MSNLTFKETTIDFRFASSSILPPLKYLSGIMGPERLLINYDLYVNGDKIDAYHLTVLEEGDTSEFRSNTSEYNLYFQDKYSDITKVFGSHDSKNFPFNVMFNLYSSISSLPTS